MKVKIKPLGRLALVMPLWLVVTPGARSQDVPPPAAVSSASPAATGARTGPMIWLATEPRLKLSRLQRGSLIEGQLARAVYWGDREVFPAGSSVRLLVDQVSRRKRAPAPDDRPFVLKFFAPRHERYLTFSQAVILTGGAEFPVQARFVGLGRQVKVYAGRDRGITGNKKAAREKDARVAGSGPVLVLRLEHLAPPFTGVSASSPPVSPPATPVTLAAGSRAQLMLTQALSASKNRPGDSFRARLLEPIRVGSRVVLPEGSMFQGLVTQRVPPRRLSRPGALYITFNRVTLPWGADAEIAASPDAAEVAISSRVRMDAEGGLHGGKPGKEALLLDLGVSAGIAKVTDDSTQLVIELLVSTATDVSTAGVAKVVAAGASGFFLLARRGRDVILPQYTRMEVSFNRPLSFTGHPAGSGARQPAR